MMDEREASLPCLVCGKTLVQEMPGYPAPGDGVLCTTSGNYGSTVFDPMDGERLRFNVCDECLTAAAEAGRVVSGRTALRVQYTDPNGDSWLVGWRELDDPNDAVWKPSLPDRGAHIVEVSAEELEAPPPWVKLTVGQQEIDFILGRT